MKRLYFYFFQSFLPLILLFPTILHAQNLTGIWRGYFITASHSQYKFELQIEQKKNAISGVSYSYLSTVFYGKATLTGVFNKSSKNALIQEIKTVELKMEKGSSACIMKCSFTHIISGNEEFLEGDFNSYYEKTDTLNEIKRGDDCGGGTVYLRKVPTSDFYTEPFLRNKVKTEPQKTQPSRTSTTPPAITKKPPVTEKGSALVKQKPVTNKPIIPVPEQKNEPQRKSDPVIIKIEEPKEILQTPDVLTSRTNELVKTLIIYEPEVTIKIYDNGEIDDDSISVYLDKRLVLSNKKLTASPLVLKIKMDENNPDCELVMVAENLGRIPPNTSLMIVEAGEKRYDVRIASTEQKNAVIRFNYQKPK